MSPIVFGNKFVETICSCTFLKVFSHQEMQNIRLIAILFDSVYSNYNRNAIIDSIPITQGVN